MPPVHVLVERDDDLGVVTMNRPERRNALSEAHLRELLAAVTAQADDAAVRAIVVAANGPVFSSGHDLADMVERDRVAMESLLGVCATFMRSLQTVPVPVVAAVQGVATAAGCQLVATADLAVAADTAHFAIPGGKGGWFCTTPLVAVGRNVGRKRALELAMTGDPIDAATAAEWGLVNKVVPADELDAATDDLLARATRGSAQSKGIGKQAYYAQIDLDQPKAYAYAIEVMAMASQTPDAKEGVAAFLEKRPPNF